ncbi:hypothetical protein FRC04_003446 [Tulasnella sp. 424]|nr:hypothetical protein FRC04_003446 [Tulasnella sp. 424]KAG8965765.1 hypothetical protein FRC05_003024 [Tulasnella sp. 425]
MTHINDLPPELLSTIFSIIFKLSEGTLPEPTRRRSHELLDILLVCWHWNYTARATPGLWTTMYITNEPGAVQRVRRYLESSGDLPLDVVISSTNGDEQVQEAEAALQMLSNHSTRWRSLSTSLTTTKLNGSLGMTLPHLSSFSFSYSLPLPETIPVVTLDTPKLETLIAPAESVIFKHESLPALKRLDILFLWGFESWVWRLLGASQSSLESLVLLVLRWDQRICMSKLKFEETNGHGTAVSSLPVLRSLEIRALSDWEWSTLRFATMPSLTQLTLDLDFFPILRDCRQFLPTLISLQSLSICTYSSSNVADTINVFLELAPNVTSLIVTDKSGCFAADEEHMVAPLVLTSAASSREPLAGKNLEEVHLLRVPTSAGKLKQLVDLRAGRLKKVVLTKGWDVAQERPAANRDTDNLILAWLKDRVTLEEVEGDWD